MTAFNHVNRNFLLICSPTTQNQDISNDKFSRRKYLECLVSVLLEKLTVENHKIITIKRPFYESNKNLVQGS